MRTIWIWICEFNILVGGSCRVPRTDCKQDSFSSYNKVGIILFLVIRISYVFED